MQKILLTICISILLFSCGHNQEPELKTNTLIFKVLINPSFQEIAEVTLHKADDKQEMRFFLKQFFIPNKSQDTFYFKTVALSVDQFDKFNSEVIQKIKNVKSSYQKVVINDGMPVRFTLIQNNDTSQLYFRNPDSRFDTSGYKITKTAVDNLRLIFKDTIINDYLDDIEANMDNTKTSIHATDNRAINKLRKIEYNR